MCTREKVLIAYIPVLHAGYLRWLRAHADARVLYLVPTNMLPEERWVAKEIRALAAGEVLQMLSGMRDLPPVLVLSPSAVRELRGRVVEIHMPDDELMRTLAAQYFKEHNIEWGQVFLRWDRRRVEAQEEPPADECIDAHTVPYLRELMDEAERSSDFWIQVGALAVRDGTILLKAHNTHAPSEYAPYALGDPRMFYTRGVRTELSTADHAERLLIGVAARSGIALAGSELYLNTFPCPSCAWQIVDAGFSAVYYVQGYSLLGAGEILRAAGIRLIRMQTKDPVPT